MQIVPSLLFGASASLDALLVGITFGMRKANIRIWQNLFISTITLMGTCLSVGLGAQLTLLLSVRFWELAGSLILICFGLYYFLKFMREALQKYHQRPECDTKGNHSSAEQASSSMTFSETCALGCALSVNNMGIGLSASIAGLSLLPAATVTFVFSAVFLSLGNRLGRKHLLPLTEHTMNLVSAFLLIVLGLLEMINTGI